MSAYASCWWLQDHVEFSWSGTVHACCYGYPKYSSDSTSWVEVGHVQVATVKDDKFPSEEIRQGRTRLHELVAANHPAGAVCGECPAVETKIWPQKKFLVDKTTLNTWSACNLKCHYCFVAHPDFKPSRVTYDLYAVMEDMLSGGHMDPDGSLTWGGGDISALPDFNKVSALFTEWGVRQAYKTSAYKYLRGVALALDKKLGLVEVSVDAGTAETYAKIKGKDAFSRVVENLHQYRQHGDIQLKFIAEKDNLNQRDITGFVDLACALNIQSVVVTPEWTQCRNKELSTPQFCEQIADLILRLRQVVPHVTPSTPQGGEQLFAGMWDEIEPYMQKSRAVL